MANSNKQKALSPPPYHLTQIRPLEGHGTQRLGNPMSMNMRDEAVQKRCVPTPRRTEGQTDGRGNMADEFSDGHGDAADEDQTNGCRRLGDNLGTETIHSYKQKTTKM